jgi:radical SAM protein with 4Fe4S-binding SPASM domain
MAFDKTKKAGPSLSRLFKILGKTLSIYSGHNTSPLYLIFFITSRCPCKCPHCFNWQRETIKKDELTIDEIEKISKSIGTLEFLFLTGGEPHFRDDMPEIARLFYLNNKIIRLQSPTTGYDPGRIIKNVERILKYCPNVQFGQGVSFDSLFRDHDNLRGINGLFEKAVETFKGLKRLEKRYPNFGVCNPIAMTTFNHDRVFELYKFLRDELHSENIFCNYIRGNPRNSDAKGIDPECYKQFCELIDMDLIQQKCRGYKNVKFNQFFNAKNIFTHRIVYDTVKEDKQQLKCLAGKTAGVLYENGDVYPCELLGHRFGNLRESGYNFEAVWNSEAAEKVRVWIKKEKCFCTHECFLTTSILFNPYWLMRCALLAFRLGISGKSRYR